MDYSHIYVKYQTKSSLSEVVASQYSLNRGNDYPGDSFYIFD